MTMRVAAVVVWWVWGWCGAGHTGHALAHAVCPSARLAASHAPAPCLLAPNVAQRCKALHSSLGRMAQHHPLAPGVPVQVPQHAVICADAPKPTSESTCCVTLLLEHVVTRKVVAGVRLGERETDDRRRPRQPCPALTTPRWRPRGPRCAPHASAGRHAPLDDGKDARNATHTRTATPVHSRPTCAQCVKRRDA